MTALVEQSGSPVPLPRSNRSRSPCELQDLTLSCRISRAAGRPLGRLQSKTQQDCTFHTVRHVSKLRLLCVLAHSRPDPIRCPIATSLSGAGRRRQHQGIRLAEISTGVQVRPYVSPFFRVALLALVVAALPACKQSRSNQASGAMPPPEVSVV